MFDLRKHSLRPTIVTAALLLTTAGMLHAQAAGRGNLALGQPTSASSVEPSTNNTADLAVDGSMTTRWSSAYNDVDWWQVDLGSEKTVGAVIINWGPPSIPTRYDVQVSKDGKTFAGAATVTVLFGGAATVVTDAVGESQTMCFQDRLARYVRIVGTQGATSKGMSFREVEIRGGDLALGQPTKASSFANNHSDDLAVDDDVLGMTDFIAARGDAGEWWQVDLGSAVMVSVVNVKWTSIYNSAFEIQTSTDGKSFTTVATGRPVGSNVNRFPERMARYIRIVNSETANAGMSFSIVSVY